MTPRYIFSLVLGLDLCGWCVACEGVGAVSGFEVYRVGGIGSEQFAFAHVEFEVVLCSSVLDEVENALCGGCRLGQYDGVICIGQVEELVFLAL